MPASCLGTHKTIVAIAHPILPAVWYGLTDDVANLDGSAGIRSDSRQHRDVVQACCRGEGAVERGY